MSRRDFESTVKVTDYEFQGVTTPIYVDDQGRFGAKWQNEWIERKSLADVKQTLRDKIRSHAQIEILATRIDDDYRDEDVEFSDVVIIGTDTRGGLLFYEADDENKQPSPYHRRSDSFYRRLTPGEREHMLTLIKARNAAQDAIDQFKNERKIDGEAEVNKAVKAVHAKADAETKP